MSAQYPNYGSVHQQDSDISKQPPPQYQPYEETPQYLHSLAQSSTQYPSSTIPQQPPSSPVSQLPPAHHHHHQQQQQQQQQYQQQQYQQQQYQPQYPPQSQQSYQQSQQSYQQPQPLPPQQPYTSITIHPTHNQYSNNSNNNHPTVPSTPLSPTTSNNNNNGHTQKHNVPFEFLPEHHKLLLGNGCYGENCIDCMTSILFPYCLSGYTQMKLHNDSCCQCLWGTLFLDCCCICFSYEIYSTLGVESPGWCYLILCNAICRPGMLSKQKRAVNQWVKMGKPLPGQHLQPTQQNNQTTTSVSYGNVTVSVSNTYNSRPIM